MAIDWLLYEEDVIRLYVDNNKTMHETIKYLQEKRGIKVRQVVPFKSKFGGLKKLSANEWRAVIKELRTRQAREKSFDVYHHGRKLNPDRDMREVRRYSKGRDNEDLVEENTSIEVTLDSHNRNRIEIRTPSPSGIQRPSTPGSVNLQIQNIEFQPGSIEGPQAELTNDELCLPSEIDFDNMYFDFSTRVDDQSTLLSGFETPCISSFNNTFFQNYGSLAMVNEPGAMLGVGAEQTLPYRQRHQTIFGNSTSSLSSSALCSVITWQGVSLPYYCSSPEIFSIIPNIGIGGNLVPLNEP
ncbi:hypothetical protein BP5796_12546 [Coleophoma crateriformis]|uniref:Clr5 domain-containing protein n=1 Tax=Coleophoma crateriformis TaxID=565419 RepID=A0A3D8Q7D0_9HELO|nr:hypothetical protein BP5796_12546 [Coleophoma crateriformis]